MFLKNSNVLHHGNVTISACMYMRKF